MISHGQQRKLVMQYSSVEWSKARLLAELKLKKSIGSEEQMHRDIHLHPLAILVAKNSKKQGQTYQKHAKSMPCVYFNDNSCSFTKHHETKGVFYRHICSSCFAQDGKVSTHSASDCKKLVKND